MSAASLRMPAEGNRKISEVVEREGSRLESFIRRRVPDPRDAEDILQEVFYELALANRLLMPIEHVTGWLFRVARNRITDWFRRSATAGEDPLEGWEPLLRAPEADPLTRYARQMLLEEIENALDELPPEQRFVFVAHEIEGRSFKDLSAETGIGVNTLLSRKRYAVIHLRKRLSRLRKEMAP